MKTVKWIYSIVLALIVIFPFYLVTISSLKPASQILNPDLFPRAFTLEHYMELLTKTTYVTNLLNSMIVSLGSTLMTVVIVIPSAYAIYRMKFVGRLFFFRLILATYIFPGILLLVPVYQLMTDIGLVDSLWSLIVMNVTFSAPFAVWLMRGFFEAVPIALDESAAIDGAGRMLVLFRIIMPLIMPGVATIMIYAFITSWTEFAYASVLISNEAHRTLPIGLKAIMGQYTVRWGWTTAGAVLTLLPVVILFSFVGKFFVRGLTAGAVK